MLYHISTLFLLNIANIFVNVQSNYLEPFLLQSTENIIVCSDNFDDMNYEVLMAKNNQSTIWISEWDCKTIPEVDNSVIVLDEVQPNRFTDLLNQEGIQKNIFRNIWVIYIIINVLWSKFWKITDRFGRAIARWNRLGLKTMDQWKIFASRAPRARSARKCVFLLHKPP